jgi:hypothetical protein
MTTVKDALLAGVGAAIGGAIAAGTGPHYEDIHTGGANRTAVFGDVMAMRAIVGAIIGASIGGLIAGITDPSTAPATPTVPATGAAT